MDNEKGVSILLMLKLVIFVLLVIFLVVVITTPKTECEKCEFKINDKKVSMNKFMKIYEDKCLTIYEDSILDYIP